MSRTALVLAAALAAGPAAAQDLPDAGALADLAMAVCVQAETDPDLPALPEGFEPVERDEDSASFAHPAGIRLALASRPEFFSCEIEIPQVDRDDYEALFAAFSPRLAEAWNPQDFEQVEDGQVWEFPTPEGTRVTTELRFHEEGRITLTSSTQIMPATAPEQN